MAADFVSKFLFSIIISEKLVAISPQLIHYLRWLAFITCENNQLQEIPKSIGHLKELRSLILSVNQITEIPRNLRDCCLLEQLIITRNRLYDPEFKIVGRVIGVLESFHQKSKFWPKRRGIHMLNSGMTSQMSSQIFTAQKFWMSPITILQ